MQVRSLLVAGALTFASVMLASAKTYDIIIPAPVKAGGVELKPGVYKLKIEGSQAVFTDTHDKSFSVPATVENADRKFGSTLLESANQNGIDTIQAIDLGDSNTRVKLGQ